MDWGLASQRIISRLVCGLLYDNNDGRSPLVSTGDE